MTYIERTQRDIRLTSPKGFEFIANWSGDSRGSAKQVGVFKTPGVKGVETQDLDVDGMTYNIPISFAGADNDLTAAQFIEALKETGKWSIIHPIWGPLKDLQLMSFTQPTEFNTGITQTVLEFLETNSDTGTKSAQQLAAETIAQNITVAATASDQINTVVSQDTADKAGKLKTAVEKTVQAFNNNLESITETVADVQDQANSIKRGISATLDGTPIDVLSVAAQIQALVNLPNLVVTDLKSKLNSYQNFANAIFEFSPTAGSIGDINTAAVQELAQTAAIGAAGVASVTTLLLSRQNVIDNVEANILLFDSVADGLDAIQELYDGELISQSYYSQSQSFADTALLSTQSLAYLIKSAFDLAIEKRILITEWTNPVMMAMDEYDGLGLDDVNILLFNSSNELTGQELLILPAGREVVVYL